jgi:FKBP-type peptidyl-prolyl cis-trans isomerase FklB
MKMKLLSLVVLSFAVTTVAIAADDVMTDQDKISYSIGVDLGKNFKQQEIQINPAFLAKGMQDAIEGKPLALTPEQMQTVVGDFQKSIMAKRAAKMQMAGKENKTKGDAFLAANKSKPGVITLSSGLQYKILTEGKGAKPSKDDTVTVEYTGTLINGKVFDTTERLHQPATFKVSQVVPGWVEALQLMPEGSTWEVYVPAKLGYGDHNVGTLIGPNETLIFKIHLVSIKK